MSGKVIEIYRCPANGKPVDQQKLEDVYLLLKDGTWRSDMRNILVDEIFKGKFDEENDEIPEEEAKTYYREWQTGQWPGKN